MRLALMLGVSLSLVASPLAAQRAGELISADPVVDTPGGMQAWRVAYWTANGGGQPIRVTGMVVAPREAIPPSPRNVIAWAHGTSGVATRCALSTNPLFWQVTPALDAVLKGNVVVAPDYPGLGSEGVHPYLVGVDTAQSVLDAIRAAREIPGAAAGSRFAVWGESQGGHAALWTGQIARSYAPELQLVGVAAAAPPTNLIANFRQIPNKTVGAMLTSYLAYSWSHHYGAPMATLGGPQTRGIMTRLAQNNCVELGKKPRLSTIAGILTVQSRLKNKDFGVIQPWARLTRENSPSVQPFGVPLLIAQNPKDDLVAPAVTRAYTRLLCRSKAQIKWIDISGEGHATSAHDSAAVTLAWIDTRFAGRLAPSDCGKI